MLAMSDFSSGNYRNLRRELRLQSALVKITGDNYIILHTLTTVSLAFNQQPPSFPCALSTLSLPSEHESIFKRKYEELLKESCGIRWFSDGSIDVKKSIHVSMGSYFSISNEMTFMIVFNMLYARDRHQLFELLCLQLTSIILAYRESIKEITKCIDGDDEFYNPEEFLNC
jgi:hypothetical protein